MDTTEVVHEAFLRLLDQRRVDWRNRSQFFSVAARVMRRVVVDQARRQKARKRGGRWIRVELREIADRPAVSDPSLVELDAALASLEETAPDAARLVELRYFAGLTIEEAAEVLGVGRTTVTRTWRWARAWLRDQMEAAEEAT